MSIARACIETADRGQAQQGTNTQSKGRPRYPTDSGFDVFVKCAMFIRLDMPWGQMRFLGSCQVTAAESLQYSPPIRQLLL